MTREESIRARRAQPLRPRRVGVLGGEVLGAWASWDRVELRTASGEVALAHEIAEEGAPLMHAFHFVAGRWLVVEVGTGIMANGFRVWDAERRAWTVAVDERWSDVGLAAAAPDRPALLMGDGAELVCFDVTEGKERWSVHAPDVYVAAFEPDGARVATVGADRIAVYDDAGEEQVAAAWVGGEPTAVAWAGERLTTVAWGGELRLWDAATLASDRSTQLPPREVQRVVADAERAICASDDGVWVLDLGTLESTRHARLVDAEFVEGVIHGLGADGLVRI